MSSLAKVEWLKMRRYHAFWWIMSLTLITYPGMIYIFYQVFKNITGDSNRYGQFLKMAIGNPFTFPEVWHTIAFVSSLFIFIPAVVVIMLVCNEYTFKTHRQNIIDGWSRSQFITSKLVDVLIISGLITLLYLITTLITGWINQERLIVDVWSQIEYLWLLGLQIFAQLSLAFMFGFLIKRSFLALGAFLFYLFVFENILVGLSRYYHSWFGEYLPLEISDRLIPPPAFLGKLDLETYNKNLAGIPKHIFLTILFTSIIWSICYWINKRKDLK